MKTTAHGDYLFKLTRMWAFNCFLVREEDGFALVDTGLSGSAQQILDAAQALGAPIVRIALTHAHVDHVGSLRCAARALAASRSLDYRHAMRAL